MFLVGPLLGGLALTLGLLWTLTGGAMPVAAAPAAEITVCPAGSPTCNYATIQEAVDAANPNDIIKVAGGTYRDTITRTAIPPRRLAASSPRWSISENRSPSVAATPLMQ